MAEWMKLGPFTVFDLETTGMSPTRDRILEIGAVRLDIDGTITRFETLVNPSMPIPHRSTQVHGITDDMVAHKPSVDEIIKRFKAFVGDEILIGAPIQIPAEQILFNIIQ